MKEQDLRDLLVDLDEEAECIEKYLSIQTITKREAVNEMIRTRLVSMQRLLSEFLDQEEKSEQIEAVGESHTASE